VIRIEALSKRYRNTVALERLDLEIGAGELFGLLGPNGAGKTTTLQILAGLLAPTSGSAAICGFDLERQGDEARRRLGYVPDRPYVHDRLTGRELLGFVTELYGLDRAESRREAERWLQRFDMQDRADEVIASYSHGMTQRIVLAATLLPDPEVLILDEPMVGLDPRGARLLKDLLRERCGSGKTVLISTHTLDVAEETCDRIGILDRGRLVELGSIEELRSRSASSGRTLEAIFLEMTEDPPGAGDEAPGD